MWTGRGWLKLLASLGEERALAGTLVRRRAVRGRICALLSREHLPNLTWSDLSEVLCRAGAVTGRDGAVVGEDQLTALTPEELASSIVSGHLVLSGNQTVDVGGETYNSALPGMDDLQLERIRALLGELLYTAPDPVEVVDELAQQGGPISPACASLALCVMYPDRFGIWHPTRVRGAKKLAWLLDSEARWARCFASYGAFNGLLHQIRANSEGMLEDLLAVDALLDYLSQMREPRYWKVAIGLTQPEAEAEALAARCLRRGFAAIGSAVGEKDHNITRLRQMLPGDYVVMHLRGRVGGVGRVVRPYYRLDPEHAGVLDREWPHRVDVDWVAGERAYGSLLTGAQQRFTVAPLSEPVFWQLAEMYEEAPEYAQVLRPQRGAWVFAGDETRCQELASVDKPLPLRHHWRVQPPDEPLRIGDTVLIFRWGTGGGICALAKVLGVSAQPPRGLRVDLLHEHRFEPPVPLSALVSDDRLAGLQRLLPAPPTADEPAPATRLTSGQTTAVLELLRWPEERYFVLMVEQSRPPALRRGTQYQYRHEGPGQPQELTEAAQWTRANCLIYHGAPSSAFAGFGPVIQVQDTAGASGTERLVTVSLAAQRFSSPAQHGALSAAWRRRARDHKGVGTPPPSVTVLAISARDYYRVVAAGLRVTHLSTAAPDLAAFAHDCCIPLQVARDLERLLRERGQMIFYGPPGTGKTWLALRLADYLADGDTRRQEFVQFHPAYSYEDFIEGIRPEAVEGPDGRMEITYPMVPGVFVRFCERARGDPGNTYVFVIDEINRAQIAKVFGELMVLLEYRGRRVRLASPRPSRPGEEGWDQGGEGFSVPKNVLLLGTMNTADRSIALVDYALRRRFLFYPFFPDDDHLVRPMLRTWLARHRPDMLWVADLLDEVNVRLAEDVGRALLIGPTYFMRPDLDETRLREIWRFQISPLLEEYFAGMPDGLQEYDLERMISRVRGPHYPVLSPGARVGERE